MSFDVAAAAYGRFMGRYSEPLADVFVELGSLAAGQRALDVGCGPGALTARLVDRLGVGSVSAVDPSSPFVEAARSRFAGLDVRLGKAEALPFDDDSFDAALAQLVVHFMADPVAGLREMRRVTKPGGVIAACVWDHHGGGSPLSLFWDAVHVLDPGATDESELAGAREGHLEQLAEEAGVVAVEAGSLSVVVGYDSFEEWWAPYTMGVGPAGSYVAGLDETARAVLREACATRLPAGGFEVTASAWWVRGGA